MLINRKKLSEKQMEIVSAIVKYYRGKKHPHPLMLTRKELRDAHGAIAKRRAAPYFISKNIAAKVKPSKDVPRGTYNLGVFLNFQKAAKTLKAKTRPKVAA